MIGDGFQLRQFGGALQFQAQGGLPAEGNLARGPKGSQ